MSLKKFLAAAIPGWPDIPLWDKNTIARAAGTPDRWGMNDQAEAFDARTLYLRDTILGPDGASNILIPSDGFSESQSIVQALNSVVATPEKYRRSGFSDRYAIMKALEHNDAVYLPAGITYALDDGLLLERPGQTFYGPGRLVAGTAAMQDKAVVLVRGDNSYIHSLDISNPNEYMSATTTERQYGISVEANGTIVSNNRIRQCQQGISVRATGEYYHTIIQGNQVLDCIGIGKFDVPQTLGENRGDGITTWGAFTSIVGNIVTCKAGYDGRVGIHAEGLPSSAVKPGPLLDRVVVMNSNIVYGPFRRGMVVENVNNFTMNGNILPGGYSWWALAVILASGEGTIVGNSITFNRRSSLTVPWAPVNTAVYFRCNDASLQAENVLFANNTIHLGPDVTAARAILVQGVGTGRCRRIGILNNRIIGESATVAGAAIQVQNSDSVDIAGNTVEGTFQNIVSISGSSNTTTRDNKASKSTQSDYTFSAVTGCTSFRDNICTSGNGASSTSGTIENFQSTGNEGFSTVAGSNFATANLQSLVHRINSFGKYSGKQVTVNGVLHIASGSDPASTWIRQTDGSAVTPV